MSQQMMNKTRIVDAMLDKISPVKTKEQAMRALHTDTLAENAIRDAQRLLIDTFRPICKPILALLKEVIKSGTP